MVEFVAIISFIAGVLQIILFFKVWGMTNDIRELKEDHFNEINMADPYQKVNFARINLILGNKEKVKYMLLNDFITNVDQNYTNKEDSIRPYIDNLKKPKQDVEKAFPTCPFDTFLADGECGGI